MRSGRRWFFAALAVGTLLAAIVAASLVRMGSFDVAADTPHSQPVFWLMNTVRERSIAVRAASVAVPSDLTELEAHRFRCRAICGDVQLLPSRAWHEADRDRPRPLPKSAGASSRKRSQSGGGILGGEARPQDDGHAGLGRDA